MVDRDSVFLLLEDIDNRVHSIMLLKDSEDLKKQFNLKIKKTTLIRNEVKNILPVRSTICRTISDRMKESTELNKKLSVVKSEDSC